jgi:hypothetical protein
MSERLTRGLTGRHVLIGLAAVIALLATVGFAMTARGNQPLMTNAVGSASSDLAAGAAQ